jgi:hypothetical protein
VLTTEGYDEVRTILIDGQALVRAMMAAPITSTTTFP